MKLLSTCLLPRVSRLTQRSGDADGFREHHDGLQVAVHVGAGAAFGAVAGPQLASQDRNVGGIGLAVFEGNRHARVELADGAHGAAEGVRLRAFDIHLNEIDAVEMQVRGQLVNGGERDSRG